MKTKHLLGLVSALALLAGATMARAAEVTVAEFTSLDNEIGRAHV